MAVLFAYFGKSSCIRLFLTEFGKDAASGFGMQEGDVQAIGTLAGSLVNQTDALCITLGNGVGNTILYLEGYMVNTTTAIIKELLNGTFGASGLEEFDFDFANLHEGCLNLLVFYNFGLVNLQTQNITEVGQNGINTLYGNAQVFDF